MSGEQPTVAPSRGPSSSDLALRSETLTSEQRRQLAAATAAMLRAVVAGEPAVLVHSLPAELLDVAEQLVSGAFVSLKRGKHLRSCCGMLGNIPTQRLSLRQALERAADRTVWDDERFPPVSPVELEHLDMEVWLLHSPERVEARGEERQRAIEVGKHGIKVVQGESSGLFLPSVAIDHGWDAGRFLDRVCEKAGLAATAWKDDATAVFTFEGEVIHGRASCDGSAASAATLGPCRPEDLPAFADLCRQNLAALAVGAVPRYFWGAPDGMANGVVLALHLPGGDQTRSFHRFSLRPGVPLQATLFALLQNATQYLVGQGLAAEAIDAVEIGVLFLHEPMLHGTVADPHLAGFDPRQRALLVLERNKVGLAFDRAGAGEALLAEAAGQAQVSQPGSAVVFSLRALSNASRLRVSTAPGPVRGPAVRPAAVAGKFYPALAGELFQLVDQLLAGEATPGDWPAAMVPHAGLRYSGRIAADVLKSIRIPQTVLVLGPKHTPLGMDWAVAPHQTWALPGAELASDFILARRLCQAIPGLELDAAAHEREHAIEVELPLLARLAPEAKVVGIAIGQGDLESCRRFAKGLAEVVRGWPDRPLLLISSDMNHFANDAETRRLDALALAALESGDPEQLYETVARHKISMCGVLPAVIVLETLRLLGAPRKSKRVGYATTADTTGDPSRVVGYAGMLLGGEPAA